MDATQTAKLVEQLATGFEALQGEYQSLWGQHESLERKLATAREQYNELAKLCGSGAIVTPPLSLSSSPGAPKTEPRPISDIATIIERGGRNSNADIANKVRLAVTAAHTLRTGLPRSRTNSDGVKIWSGPAADQPEAACSTMPSISESPLEQDFTIEGKPSRLGCPFASMAGKKLSSHAASVLSRYNTRDTASAVPSTPLSSVSRVYGKESLSRRESRRASFLDPIKAEICGLSDHHPRDDASVVEVQEEVVIPVENAEAGVCPIRFMDQHSPEEVATYFEKHKHELPRSHETCVRRYQSNEEQIRELDSKYGNLVSMIQGLGAKHKELLPEEPADPEGEETEMDQKSHEKVAQWASSVSARAADGHEEAIGLDDDRQPHFERPLREVRVGESPSRPWGITVPEKYLEETKSHASSKPVEVPPPAAAASPPELSPAKKCPFGHGQQTATQAQTTRPAQETPLAPPQPTFIAQEAPAPTAPERIPVKEQPRMVFTGPVFFGYSADDAAKILRESGLAGQPT